MKSSITSVLKIANGKDNLGIIQAQALKVLAKIPDKKIDLIYVDPVFNTGKKQSRESLTVTQSEDGDRIGFGGKKYKSRVIGVNSYDDSTKNYADFIIPHLEEAHRVLKDTGSFFLHLDYREIHYCKVWLDEIFGRKNFMNEIIWAYDYGGRSKRKWSAKHDTILWYTKDKKNYTFNFEEMDRIPYMAPGLVGKEKAARGKTPTDVFWHTIVPTNGKEKTGYPTQKPLGLINRIVKVHSLPGDLCMDFFAGSGTFGESCLMHGRRVILVDSNKAACKVMKKRLKNFNVKSKKRKAKRA